MNGANCYTLSVQVDLYEFLRSRDDQHHLRVLELVSRTYVGDIEVIT